MKCYSRGVEQTCQIAKGYWAVVTGHKERDTCSGKGGEVFAEPDGRDERRGRLVILTSKEEGDKLRV